MGNVTTVDRTSRRSTADLVVKCVTMVLGIVFLSAAASKAYSIADFAPLIRHIGGGIVDSIGTINVAAILLIMWEAFLGSLLVCVPLSRSVLVAALITLLGFSVVLVFMMADSSIPACGCGGVLSTLGRSVNEAPVALVRNGILILLTLGLWRRRGVR